MKRILLMVLLSGLLGVSYAMEAGTNVGGSTETTAAPAAPDATATTTTTPAPDAEDAGKEKPETNN